MPFSHIENSKSTTFSIKKGPMKRSFPFFAFCQKATMSDPIRHILRSNQETPSRDTTEDGRRHETCSLCLLPSLPPVNLSCSVSISHACVSCSYYDILFRKQKTFRKVWANCPFFHVTKSLTSHSIEKKKKGKCEKECVMTGRRKRRGIGGGWVERTLGRENVRF